MSLLTSRYARSFATTAAPSDEGGPYVRPREVVDDDEGRWATELVGRFEADARSRPRGAGKDDPAFHEEHWGHTTGLLRGTLAIDAVEALPEPLRVGLFEKAATFPVIARANFVDDKKARFQVARMGIKIRYPSPVPNVYAESGEAHELDLLLAEGAAEVNGIGHTFFVRDAREFAMVLSLAPPSGKTAGTLLDVRNWGLLSRVGKALARATAYTRKPPSTQTGWAGKGYYALGPFALGDGAMKLCLRPRQQHPIAPIGSGDADATKAHRAAMRDWVAAGVDAVFDLCVQVATPNSIPEPGPDDPPKSVMVAEYCNLDWDEVASPYVKVGTLTLPAAPEADLSLEYPSSPLQLNAWNTLPEMRPLGHLFRARKLVHRAHSNARVEHIFDATPGAMVDKAPFTPDA